MILIAHGGVEVEGRDIRPRVAVLIQEILSDICLLEGLRRTAVGEEVAACLDVGRSWSELCIEVVVAQEELMLKGSRSDIPRQIVIEGVVTDVTEALRDTHQDESGIIRAISLLDESIVLRVLHHILTIGGVEVGAIEEEALCQLMREGEGQIQRLLTQIVIGCRLRRRDGAGEEIPVAKDRDTTVELPSTSVVHQIHVEASALRGEIGDGGSDDLSREPLQITEGVGVLIAEIEAVKECLALIQRSRKVGIGATRIEAPSRQRYRATGYIEGLLRHTIDDTTWGSIPEECGSRALDDLDALDIGQR